MSREQYQAPNTGSQQTFGGAGGRDFGAENAGGIMHYTCGDCAESVPLEKGAPIRCQKCGARVLYKQRTAR